MIQDNVVLTSEKNSLFRDSVKNFRWLPVSIISIGGGAALVDIAEKVFIFHFTLLTPFKIFLNGYNRIINVVGGIIEPVVNPLIRWINYNFQWDLHLQESWKSIFVIIMIIAQAFFREIKRESSFIKASVDTLILWIGALIGSLIGGLAVSGKEWWEVGFSTIIPFIAIMIAIFLNGIFDEIKKKDWRAVSFSIFGATILAPAGGASFGLLTFWLSQLMPSISHGASIIVLSFMVALFGLILIALRTEESVRSGASILGGFATAGLILVSSWAIKLAQ